MWGVFTADSCVVGVSTAEDVEPCGAAAGGGPGK
jgi:hypothetical protein